MNMQTKQQIQRLLESAGIRPVKRLGQHFLIDLNLMRLLLDSAQIGKDDVVLEVGCGTGSLTQAIAEKAGHCVAVELDENLARIAEEQLANHRNVTVVNTDILDTKNAISKDVTELLQNYREMCPGRFVLVANLPYNAAASVMMNLVTGPTTAEAMYVTVQKEVAERMAASPGNSDYGKLSILLSATGNVEKIRILKPGVFWPQPQVDSAMIGFVGSEQKASRIGNMKLFGEVVSLFMGHRRKMLKSAIKSAKGRLAEITNWQGIFADASVDPHTRPDRLAPETYVTIAKLCAEQSKQD